MAVICYGTVIGGGFRRLPDSAFPAMAASKKLTSDSQKSSSASIQEASDTPSFDFIGIVG